MQGYRLNDGHGAIWHYYKGRALAIRLQITICILSPLEIFVFAVFRPRVAKLLSLSLLSDNEARSVVAKKRRR